MKDLRQNIHPESLRVEYLVNPIGIDVKKPRFFWKMPEGTTDGIIQEAFQIQVFCHDSEEMQWDFGWIESAESIHIEYEGIALKPCTRYDWQVRIRSNSGIISSWQNAWWETGMLDNHNWRAQWIKSECQNTAPYFRKCFDVDKAVKSARMYSTFRGIGKMYLNGKCISDDYFFPGFSDYNCRNYYQSFDVSGMIKNGKNMLGAVVGNGWYSGNVASFGVNNYGSRPELLAELHLFYEDGSVDKIITDESWHTHPSPWLVHDLIMGETYDAMLEQPDWCVPGGSSLSWMPVIPGTDKKIKLIGQFCPPVKEKITLSPVKLNKITSRKFIVDFGQNMAGGIRIRLTGEAGSVVRMRYAETINPDGTIYTLNLRAAIATDHYIMKGEGVETFENTFSCHGFRYAEVSGCGNLAVADIEAKVLFSDLEETADFKCSDPMINQLYSNIVWGQRGNFIDIPTDCPQRDERLGWSGDAQAFCATACYNMQSATFLNKWLRELASAQFTSGSIADFVPMPPNAITYCLKKGLEAHYHYAGKAGWGDAITICPWTLYGFYGDRRVLEDYYPNMKCWVEFCKHTSRDFIRDYSTYGDWLSVKSTDKSLLSTVFFARSTDLTARTAAVLGCDKEYVKYSEMFDSIRHAFQKKFFEKAGETEIYRSQTALALALAFGLLTDEQRPQAIKMLVKEIELCNNTISCGFLGINVLLPVLSANGYHDLACKLLHNDVYPSWLYSIKHGATTIWERWDAWTEDKGSQSAAMNSFNHYTLGSVGEWLFSSLGGLTPDFRQPDCRTMLIRPRPDHKLKWCKTSYKSLYGTWRIEWHLEGEDVHLNVTIPGNCTAILILPENENEHKLTSGIHHFRCKNTTRIGVSI